MASCSPAHNRSTVLFQSNIDNSRSATPYLIEVLTKIARSIDLIPSQ